MEEKIKHVRNLIDRFQLYNKGMESIRNKFSEKNIRNRFDEMIKLSEAVHRAIIVSHLNRKAYVNHDLDSMIKWHREANPLDFLCFRAWMMTYEAKDEEEIKKKYKEIANKVLAARGDLDVCFNELLRCCKSYVINLAKEGCHYHNRYVFNDYTDSDSDSD